MAGHAPTRPGLDNLSTADYAAMEADLQRRPNGDARATDHMNRAMAKLVGVVLLLLIFWLIQLIKGLTG
eukprot:scaffold9318_cov147-Amphora_coffeaeformis.AAC.2